MKSQVCLKSERSEAQQTQGILFIAVKLHKEER